MSKNNIGNMFSIGIMDLGVTRPGARMNLGDGDGDGDGNCTLLGVDTRKTIIESISSLSARKT